jgi:hypothetical protein
MLLFSATILSSAFFAKAFLLQILATMHCLLLSLALFYTPRGWITIHTLTLKSNTAKYYFWENPFFGIPS